MSFVELPDGNYTPRTDDPRAGLRRPDLRGLQPADRRAHPVPLPAPASPGEEGSGGGGERTGGADPLLGRSGRARGRAEGADRRRDVVEPGVRGRRLPQRVPGRAAAGRCRSDGHPLQHDQLGAPLDARLELRRQCRRSAHRRDHQGHRHARLAARPPGLHDLRGAALALRDRQREAVDSLRDGHRAHPPAVGARGRPHARPRPQLLRQLQGLDLGDGLSASARRAEGRRHDRPVEGLRGADRRLGQGGDRLRLPAVRRRRHRRRRGAHEDHRRRVGAGPALLHQPGFRHPPAHRAVVERRQPGRRADPPDEGAARGARPHRREDDPDRRAR